MSIGSRLRWMAAGAAALLLAELLIVLAAWEGVGTRPPAPPEQAGIPFPWGAFDMDELPTDAESDLEASLLESFDREPETEFDADGDGVRTYPLLALSGGGANGAFGAGFLCGWTKAGTRPDFKVVTGVSTGALQSTLAFLGPTYDDTLRKIYSYATEQIYKPRGVLSNLFNDAVNDTAPLAELIARHITAEVLEAVAEKHGRGHRLYVGTTNMDTREFVIWDMGKIAASGRPDALELYRKVLLASSSIPVLFPPVYIKVQMDGREYHEMHSDGGISAQVFLRGFLLDFDDAFDHRRLKAEKAQVTLYVVQNGNLAYGEFRETLRPHKLAIATAAIDSLIRITISASLYRMYVLANRYGIEFNLAYLPTEVMHQLDPLDFDPEGMRRLFDAGYRMAATGYQWHSHPPGLDADEFFSEHAADEAAEEDE